MRTLSPLSSVLVASALACACHNQSNSDQDNAQAGRGNPPPDLTVSPPEPFVATPDGPAPSAAAANLTNSIVPSPPIHDGAVACHLNVGNLLSSGRTYTTTDAGNVALTECSGFLYVYDANKKQVARVALDAIGPGGISKSLAPRDQVRGFLPIPEPMARDENATFETVVTHAKFADGAAWDAPDRAPAERPMNRIDMPGVQGTQGRVTR